MDSAACSDRYAGRDPLRGAVILFEHADHDVLADRLADVLGEGVFASKAVTAVALIPNFAA